MTICKGNANKAFENFNKNLEYFRQYYPVKTICMHGSPMSRYDSRDLWKHYDYKQMGILGEPYFDIDFSKVLYLTDTGRRWDGEKVSVRDKVNYELRIMNYKFKKTEDIIRAAIDEILPDQIMITVHPQRWNDKPFPWLKELMMQKVKNLVKGVMVKRRIYKEKG